MGYLVPPKEEVDALIRRVAEMDDYDAQRDPRPPGAPKAWEAHYDEGRLNVVIWMTVGGAGRHKPNAYKSSVTLCWRREGYFGYASDRDAFVLGDVGRDAIRHVCRPGHNKP